MGVYREYGRFGVQLLEEKEGVNLMVEERKKQNHIRRLVHFYDY